MVIPLKEYVSVMFTQSSNITVIHFFINLVDFSFTLTLTSFNFVEKETTISTSVYVSTFISLYLTQGW